MVAEKQKEFLKEAEDLQEKLYINLFEMQKQAQESQNISNPDDNFASILSQLKNPDFNVVVCGEVKRGKSTFINALIGEEILPTGVAETTSQVFRITNSETRSSELCFNDLSRKEITFDELRRYGSQTDADLYGENSFAGKKLSFIQVNVPASFLPENVTIVDTPGLGALYKSHQEITHNYISQADAVVFVLDSSQPLVRQEEEFLRDFIFPKTPYVMFVMTKIDTVEEDVYMDLLRRNEKLLQEAFGNDCYKEPRVYPISSTLLFEAAEEDDSEEKAWYLDQSLFPSVKAEIINLITVTCGLYRNQQAYNSAIELFKNSYNSIREQLQFLSSSSKTDQKEYRDKKRALADEFENCWGAGSSLRKETISNINNILMAVKANMLQLLSASGELYIQCNNEIEELSQHNLRDYAETYAPKVIEALTQGWTKITASGESQISQELARMDASIKEFSNRQLLPQTSETINIAQVSEITKADYFMGFRSQFMNASVTTSATIALASVLGLMGPLGWATLTVGGIMYGILGGRSHAKQKHLEKNKIELKKGLQKIFLNAKKQMVEVSVMDGKHASTLDAYIKEMQNASQQAIEITYSTAHQRFKQDCKKLDEQYNMNLQAQKQEIEQLNNQLSVWTRTGKQLQILHDRIKAVNHEFMNPEGE